MLKYHLYVVLSVFFSSAAFGAGFSNGAPMGAARSDFTATLQD